MPLLPSNSDIDSDLKIMKDNKNYRIEKLIVDFYNVELGLLFFKLKIGEQEFEGRFSEVFDPLMNFKYWLESISIGVQQTSFHFDPEGEDIKFDFEQVHWNKAVLTISELYAEENQPPFIKAEVDRKQIVKAFYLGLFDFHNSEKFISKEWEIEYMKERLEKVLSMNEKEVIVFLLDLNRKELKRILFKADPIYYISYPEAKDENENWNMSIQDILDEEKGCVNNLKKEETPFEYDIPEDYDYWSIEKKKNFILECINYPTNGNEGTKIKYFRSSIIEEYLEKQY